MTFDFWAGVFAAVCGVAGIGLLIAVGAGVGATGPGCPGDPEWLGRCAEVQP